MTDTLIFSDIQANILKPHNRIHNCFIAFQLRSGDHLVAEDYRRWIQDLACLVTSHQQQMADTTIYKKFGIQRPVINIGLSHDAYTLMNIRKEEVPNEVYFTERTKYAETFRVYGNGTPLNQNGFDVLNEKHHVLLCIAHDRKSAIEEIRKKIRESAGTKEVVEDTITQFARQKRRKRNPDGTKGEVVGPFGFADGIANPKEADAFEVAFGQKPATLKKGSGLGTYLIVQKIQLFQEEFDKQTQLLRDKLNKNRDKNEPYSLDYAKALLVGRFPDGTPLDLHDGPKGLPSNEFSYNNDAEGTRCPLHAHIRKVNRREKNAKKLCIIRRGINFTESHIRADGKEEKQDFLLFLSFQASIMEQLLPLYNNMDAIEGESYFDALVYADENGMGKNHYYSEYNNPNSQIVKFPSIGGKITRFISGAFFYLPPLSFFRNLLR